jgi:glucose-6-phosphate dehydrogenase assembly protein OpcA
MATVPEVEEWSGKDVAIAEVERELSVLSQSTTGSGSAVRTSVMTHIAWVPGPWLEAATTTLAGLAERHPSRTIVLVPEPESGQDGIDARVSIRRYALEGVERNVCSEVVEIHMRGRRAKAPASVVAPLLVADLPVFLRWRGEPPFGASEFEQLVEVVDRLVVDSSEWKRLPNAYADLAELFERVAVSDIVWTRGLAWRGAVAALWPEVADLAEARVASPEADALLLAGWLRSRLSRSVRLVHDEADTIELVALDGNVVAAPKQDPQTASDLLSQELDIFGRDRLYEAGVRAAL